MATPATVVVGSTPKTRWLAAAGVMSKLVEVAPVRRPSVAARV